MCVTEREILIMSDYLKKNEKKVKHPSAVLVVYIICTVGASLIHSNWRGTNSKIIFYNLF